jgi:hypothetical protein
LPEDQFTIVGPPKVLKNGQPLFPAEPWAPGGDDLSQSGSRQHADSDLRGKVAGRPDLLIVILATPDAASIDWYCQRLADFG